jgi:hypothetical protein
VRKEDFMVVHRPFALPVLFVVLVAAASAQMPETMNYQVMLTNDADQPLANQAVGLVFRIYDVDVGGSPVWTEPRDVETNAIGVVSLVLGEVHPIALEFTGPLWLEVEVDGEILSPRRPLTSAPYARRAHEATLFGGREAGDYVLDTDLSAPGVLNDPANPMDWTNLKGVPGGFADGSDDVGTGVAGSGTIGYVPRFTGSTAIGNSLIYDSGSGVGIGTTSIDAKLAVVQPGLSPALWLGSTSSGHGAEILTMERNEDMGEGDVFLRMSAPTASTGGEYIRCVRTEPAVSFTPFSVSLDGHVSANGGMEVTSPNGTLNTIVARNWQGGPDARVISAFCEGSAFGNAVAVYGESRPFDFNGVGGEFVGGHIGARGTVEPVGDHSYIGVYGHCQGGSGLNYGVMGDAVLGDTNIGVYGYAYGGLENWAGYFDGNVRVTGSLVNPLAGFEIDHPVDPDNRYLRHAYVGSPEMKTVYDGTATLDAAGEAVVLLPDWLEALNRDFRYQLTPIGAPAPGLYIAEPLQDSRFRIAGGEAGTVVSWMVTGVRRDAAAERSPIVVEEEKRPADRGRYVSPEAHGAPRSLGIGHVEPEKNAE